MAEALPGRVRELVGDLRVEQAVEATIALVRRVNRYVAETEPLPPESPLWKAPNLLITPHTSAVSDRLWARETALLMDLLERWFDGRELFNVVDVSRGY